MGINTMFLKGKQEKRILEQVEVETEFFARNYPKES